jgi:hypothetical protein
VEDGGKATICFLLYPLTGGGEFIGSGEPNKEANAITKAHACHTFSHCFVKFFAVPSFYSCLKPSIGGWDSLI